MSREHQQMMEKRHEVIQDEVSGTHSETMMFLKYSALVGCVTAAGVAGLGAVVPAVARMSLTARTGLVLTFTPVPGYIIAEREISRRAVERAKILRSYHIKDDDITRAREHYDKKPFFYRYRSEMTMGLAAFGLGTGAYAAFGTRGLTGQQKMVKTRMWFSTAGVGTALAIALLYAASSQQQKEDMEETPFMRHKRGAGL